MMPKPFRLTPVDPIESDRQADIINYLRHDPRVSVVLRVNGGGRKFGRGWVWFYRLFVRGLDPMDGKGCSDLLVMLRGGQFSALEVKRPDEKPTAEQAEFLAAISAGGGLAARVENWQQAKAEIDDYLNKITRCGGKMLMKTHHVEVR